MKYYKILNKEEKHNGMQYKTGLNKDTMPFKPFGSCESGGMYFSSEDILAFLSYGCWIREVILCEDSQIYEDPGSIKKFKTDKFILKEREEISEKVIKRLIEEGANPKTNDSCALRWAASNGHTEIVKMLIPVSDPKAYDSVALRLAALNGHTEIVKMLKKAIEIE